MPQVVQPVQTLDGYLTRQAWRWLAPLAAVAAMLLGWAVRDVHRHQTDEIAALTSSVAAAADEDLLRRAQGLQALVSGVLSSHIKTSLDDWYSHAQGYDTTFDSAVVLVDAGRQMLFNTRLPLGTALPQLPAPAKGRPVFDEAMVSGQPRYGNVTVGPVLRRPVVSVIVPAMGESQRLALMALVPVTRFEALLNQKGAPSGWQVAVFDAAGQRISATGDGVLLPTDRSAAAHRSTKQTQVAGWTVVVQVDRLAFYRPHLQVGGGMLLGLGLAFGGGAMAARRSRAGLVAAAQALTSSEQPVAAFSPAGSGAPRIAEIEAARDKLAHSALARRVAEDAERDRIARDLHDGLQQQAAAVKLHLDMALVQLPASSSGTDLVTVARSEIDKLIRTVDDTVRNLRPSSLSLLGLSGALGELVDQAGKVGRVQIEFEVLGGDAADALPKPVSECLYRVVQECLNNVRKHAHASFVHVMLDASEPRQVTLTVSDDGVGIDSGRSSRPTGPGMGLSGMARRVALLDGVLDVRRGQPGDAERGTTVEVRLPLPGATR